MQRTFSEIKAVYTCSLSVHASRRIVLQEKVSNSDHHRVGTLPEPYLLVIELLN